MESLLEQQFGTPVTRQPVSQPVSRQILHNESLIHYHQALSDRSIFNNCLHGLANTDYHHTEGTDTALYRTADKAVQKHINMLDGLALFLIFRGRDRKSQSVVATGMIRETRGVKIFYANNSSRQASREQRDYIDKLVEKFKNQHPVNDILKHVIQFCKEKIVQRCKKLAAKFDMNSTTLREDVSNFYGIRSDIAEYTEIETTLRDQKWIQKTSSLSTALDTFLRCAAKLTRLSTTQDIFDVLCLAYALTTITPGMENLVKPPIWRRMKKMADYRKICIRTRDIVRTIGGSSASITVDQLFPPDELEYEVYNSTLEALNTWSTVYPSDSPLQDFELQLKEYYPDAKEGQSGKIKILFSQHCELTVANYLLRLKTATKSLLGPIEIGCSKASCFWCDLYLTELNDILPKYGRVINRATHGNLCNGWMMPQALPGYENVNREVLDCIGRQVETVFAYGNDRRRKSDSLPLDREALPQDDGKEEFAEPKF
ncbi:hypothetical protein ABVK25_006368 [Lepraria finkii]|uniref:Uncharacterized protein n=1 Tax=Lepraria finkii TaxID=1340010 RepID=A0ABR4B936_9LECA